MKILLMNHPVSGLQVFSLVALCINLELTAAYLRAVASNCSFELLTNSNYLHNTGKKAGELTSSAQNITISEARILSNRVKSEIILGIFVRPSGVCDHRVLILHRDRLEVAFDLGKARKTH
jgi:hypothetical protein